jgi:hypothetical protein
MVTSRLSPSPHHDTLSEELRDSEGTNSIPFGPALDDLPVNEATACDPFQRLIRSAVTAIEPIDQPAIPDCLDRSSYSRFV